MPYMDNSNAERLVNTYSDMILRISVMYLKQTYDAEDICQDVFLKLLQRELSFDSPDLEKAWIIRSTINACKDVLRKRTVRKLISTEETSLPDRSSDTTEIADVEMMEAMQALPVNYRLSLLLFYFEGYKVREIAELLGKNENTVSAYLSRGRKRLKQLLLEDTQAVSSQTGSATGGANYVR